MIDNAFRGGDLGVSDADPDDRGTLEALDFARNSDQLDAIVLADAYSPPAFSLARPPRGPTQGLRSCERILCPRH